MVLGLTLSLGLLALLWYAWSHSWGSGAMLIIDIALLTTLALTILTVRRRSR